MPSSSGSRSSSRGSLPRPSSRPLALDDPDDKGNLLAVAGPSNVLVNDLPAGSAISADQMVPARQLILEGKLHRLPPSRSELVRADDLQDARRKPDPEGRPRRLHRRRVSFGGRQERRERRARRGRFPGGGGQEGPNRPGDLCERDQGRQVAGGGRGEGPGRGESARAHPGGDRHREEPHRSDQGRRRPLEERGSHKHRDRGQAPLDPGSRCQTWGLRL